MGLVTLLSRKMLSSRPIHASEHRRRGIGRKQITRQAIFYARQIPYCHRTIETITWRPWLESAVSELDDVRRASLLSSSRMPLQVLNGNCEYYLGDRCWRQLTSTAGIPLDPPLSMSPYLSPAELQVMRHVGFIDCEQFVIGEERENYTSYWANQTAELGPLLIDSKRMGNIYLFGPSALMVGITPVVVTSASVHSLSQDFSLPGRPEGPDLG
ncbi:hypothetical protein GIB67_015423 [Kingdonia uniflora]|uniref:Uncharacterized protein n=1 Tax=Kingdonia uniflora TaxID=39325 RepID=A0A7J7KYW7_9MAGN|nr:hypothetical protein GIB67_015423 [Kingdonia uniflora]